MLGRVKGRAPRARRGAPATPLTRPARDDVWGGLSNTEAPMRIYTVSLEVVENVCALANRVQQYDRDLARQMRRACSSVTLNMAEGMYSRGGNRVARFHDAMGSAKETMACLHVCVASKYLAQAQALALL